MKGTLSPVTDFRQEKNPTFEALTHIIPPDEAGLPINQDLPSQPVPGLVLPFAWALRWAMTHLRVY